MPSPFAGFLFFLCLTSEIPTLIGDTPEPVSAAVAGLEMPGKIVDLTRTISMVSNAKQRNRFKVVAEVVVRKSDMTRLLGFTVCRVDLTKQSKTKWLYHSVDCDNRRLITVVAKDRL